MIINSTLTHGDFLSPLQSWRPSLQVINAFFIAALTTIFSYQLTASISDIALGWKDRCKATATNFQVKLLANEFSVLAILTALLRYDFLDRLRFRRIISKETQIDRIRSPIQWKTTVKLFLLLLIPQIVNLLAVVLTIERDEFFSFADAKFNGISLGINDDGSTIRSSGGWRTCMKLDFQTRVPDAHNVADFFTCFIVSCDYEGGDDFQRRELDLSLWSTPQGEISIYVNGDITDGTSFYEYYGMSAHGVVMSNGRTFRVKQSLNTDEAVFLFKMAQDIIAENCTSPIPEPDVKSENGVIKVSQTIPCGFLSFKRVIDGTDVVYRRLTFIETGEFLVANEEEFFAQASANASFASGEDIPLMVVRSSLLNSGALVVSVAVAVILRVLLKFALRNDIDYGIESSLKAALGLPSYSSLIYSDLKVKYDAGCSEEYVISDFYRGKKQRDTAKIHQIESSSSESSDRSSSEAIFDTA